MLRGNLIRIGVTAIALLAAPVSPHAGDSIPATALSVLMDAALQAERDGRADRAADLFRQAHEAAPFDGTPLIAWGRLATRLGDPETAIRLFQAALGIANRDSEARRSLGEALLDLERGDEALAVYDALLAEDAADGRAWNGRGQALALVGRGSEAPAAYAAGLAVAPNDPDLRANLALALVGSTATPHVATAPATSPTLTLAFNAAGGDAVPRPLDAPAGRVSSDPTSSNPVSVGGDP